MSDEAKKSEQACIVDTSEDEIDLLELAKTIWKGRKLIIWTALALTLTTVAISLFMTNIYTARAIIKPTSQSQSGSKLSALAGQFGGLASLAGIAMPSSASSTEIVALLESNILKKEVIENYQLLPVLLPDQWDERSKTWKKPGVSLNPLKLISKFTSGEQNKEPGILYIWDGIRKLEDIANVNYNVKEDIITISVDFPDPEMAAKIVHYFIITLNEHMSSDAKRMALVNREYLEKQIEETSDPIVRQKIYNLIADKIEMMMMAEVKEGFAFKILDPPMAPDKKSKPKRAQMAVVAFILSLFIGVFAVLFKEYIKKIKENSAGGRHA